LIFTPLNHYFLSSGWVIFILPFQSPFLLKLIKKKSPFISLSFKMGGHFPQRMLNTHPLGFVGVIVSHLHGYMLFTLIVVQHYLLSHKREVMFVMVLLAIFKLQTYQ
jgi:hypothetical protein